MSALRIAVVGAGIGGMTVAILLSRAGHRVTLFETFPEPRPLGAGFLLQPTGLAVLDRLGLGSGIRACGADVAELRGHTMRGRAVMTLSYRDIPPGSLGLGVQRGALFSLLYGALLDCGCRLVTGCKIVGIEGLDSAQAKLRDAEGDGHGPFELVVVANGSASALRGQVGRVRRDRPYRWGAVWALCPDPEEAFSGCLSQVYDGPRRMCGVLPVGRLPEVAGPPLVSFFWSLRADRYEAWRARGLAAWKREMADYWPAAAQLLDAIDDPAQLLWAGYRDVVVRPCHRGPAVVIGDAAHCTSPQLGQGANLALIDALVLCETLHSQPDVEAALRSFAAARRSHVGVYQIVSRALTPFFQSDRLLLGWLRDWLFHGACRFPPLRREMLLVLTGRKSGAFGRFRDFDS